jgi:hypothetical protein
MSIFAFPRGSIYTRTERLSVCFFGLLAAMMAGALFFSPSGNNSRSIFQNIYVGVLTSRTTLLYLNRFILTSMAFSNRLYL